MVRLNPGVTGVEIASLTSIRGIAACWIVLLHSSALIFGMVPEATFLKPLTDAGHFAVPLFFILSGYVLGLRYAARLESPRRGDLIRFWWLRLGRVYPVHLCTLLISLVMVARRGWPADEGHSPGRFVANCLLIHSWDYDFRLSWNYPSWSISSEWFAYLLFPLIVGKTSGLSRRNAAIFALCACALSILVYSCSDQLKFRGLAAVLPTFVGGVCLAVACPPGLLAGQPRPWAELGLLAAVLVPFVAGPGPLQVALYLALFFALVGFLGGARDRISSFWRNRFLLYFGDISYSLYMTHAIMLTILTKLIGFDDLESRALTARVAALLGCSALILLASMVMYHVVERPLRDLSRRTMARGGGRSVQSRDVGGNFPTADMTAAALPAVVASQPISLGEEVCP